MEIGDILHHLVSSCPCAGALSVSCGPLAVDGPAVYAHQRQRFTVYLQSVATDNEMNETTTTNIQDTKWRLQPVGTKEAWPFNQMPLRVEVNKGGKDRTGEDDKYYYGSLYVPFDTRLGNTTDAAFTLTGSPSDGTLADPGSATMASVSQYNEMGNPQFVPAAWPVVLRTNIDKNYIVLKNADETDYAKKYFVNMYLPNNAPTVISGALETIKLSGKYLEEQMGADAAHTIMVFGLPFSPVEGHNTHEYDKTKQVGFFTNDNWARETSPGYKAHNDSYPSTASVASHSERNNKYVYHNKIYYVFDKAYSAPAAPRYAIAIFDDIEEEDEPIEDTATESYPWPCDVYDTQGRLVAKDETPETLRKNYPFLPRGIYIFAGRKIVVR